MSDVALNTQSNKAPFKINLGTDKLGLFHRVFLNLPREIDKEKMKPSTRSMLEKIYSYTRKKEDKITGCRLTYKQGCEELGRGRSTVALALEELRSAGLIQKIDRDVDGTEYVYVGDPTGGKYYVIPLYLYSMSIAANGEYRKITTCETHVLGYLMNECGSPLNGGNPEKGGGVCKTSFKKLSRLLGFSISALRQAIYALMKAKLVYRPKRNKGKNGLKLSGYEVNSSLYIYRKYIKKAKTKEENAQARTSYYQDLREQAERRADKYMNIARKNAEFVRVHSALKQMEIKFAKAEIYDPTKLPMLKNEARSLEARKASILRKIGLTLEDIEVQYNCEKCKDTGQMPSGKLCPCYPGGAL